MEHRMPGPHPQHGLNPTMVQCFVCRHPTNEVFLYGSFIPEKAPSASPVDFRLCAVCEEKSVDHRYLQECGIGYDDDGGSYPEWFGDGVWVPKKEHDAIFGEDSDDCGLHFIETARWHTFKEENVGFDYDPDTIDKKTFVKPR